MVVAASEHAPRPDEGADPIGAVLLGYAAKELHRALACLGWRGSRLHEGVHQARKSLRRTRATLALGSPGLGHDAPHLDKQLRRVNRSLSGLRDVHALVETLDRLIRKHRSPGLHRLLQRARRAALRHRAATARRELHADADFADRRESLKTLASELRRLPWVGVHTDNVRAALEQSVANAATAAGHALGRGTDEDWHRWRRRVRRLSQQHRALRDSAELRHASEADIKALATSLGEVQDYFLLKEHCGKDSPFSTFDRPALAALAAKGLRRGRLRIAGNVA
jgi:CHAD domain-containing protein